MPGALKYSIGCLTAVAFGLLGLVTAQAQTYPSKPVALITSTAAGGGPDVIARIVAERLSAKWRQQVFVENRVGGRGIVATLAVTHAPPDGYTLYAVLGSTYVVLPVIEKNLPFDLQRDLIPIGLIGEQPFVIAVDGKSDIKTLADLIARAKANPEKILYGTVRGSMPHLVTESLQRRAGTNMTMVPYPATTKAVSDVVAGRITAVVDSLSALGGAIQGGQLKALAVTSMTRLHDFPDLPTVAEMFPGLSGNGWFVLAAPAGTPDAVLQKASQDLSAVLEDNEVKAKFARLGTYSRSLTAKETADFIRGQRETWSPVADQIELMTQ